MDAHRSHVFPQAKSFDCSQKKGARPSHSHHFRPGTRFYIAVTFLKCQRESSDYPMAPPTLRPCQRKDEKKPKTSTQMCQCPIQRQPRAMSMRKEQRRMAKTRR